MQQKHEQTKGRNKLQAYCLNLDLPPIELKVETKAGRKKYVQALKNADNGSHYGLEKIIGKAIEETIEGLALSEEK